MHPIDREHLILELLEGKATAAELSERHGIDAQELLAWRDTWLAGARAATRTRPPNRRWWVVGAVAAAALLGLVSKEALAATCAAPTTFSSLGLNYFCPNDPAVAAEFNANTLQLVNMMQQKLGAGWGAADAGISSTGITTTAATVTGDVTIAPPGDLNFGTSTRQMVNLWTTDYGIGVQNSTLYFRSGVGFAWYVGGTHANNQFDPGGGTEAMRLTSNGALSVRGLKQVDTGAMTSQPYEVQRLVVDATPARNGLAVPIDYNVLASMCRDDDGCQMTVSLVNWDGQGNVATRVRHFYMSQTNNSWRVDNDIWGVDGNGAMTDFNHWDCYFGDFDTATDANNGRTDTRLGFGLLNCKNPGCASNESDTTTTCRVTFRD